VRMHFAQRRVITDALTCSVAVGRRMRAWSEPNRMQAACLHSLYPPYEGPFLLVPHPRADPARRGYFPGKSSENLKAG
jgi:hypothetical protein